MTIELNLDPDDAIIRVAAGNYTVDPGIWLAARLKEGWDPRNTDQLTPKLYFREATKNFTFRQDSIVMYSVSETETPVTLTYGFKNKVYVYTLDFYTIKDRVHLNRLMEEARRVIEASRKDPFKGLTNASELTGRFWLTWGQRISPYERNLNQMYRRSVDVVFNWQYREITE